MEIIPNLWLGSIKARFDKEFLDEKGITCVINCATENKVKKYATEPHHLKHGDIIYYNLNLRDRGDERSMKMLYDIYDIVTKSISLLLKDGHVVLVHCYAGKYRSPSVVMAFIMRYGQLPYENVYATMKRRYKSVSSFYSASLVRYENEKLNACENNEQQNQS